MQVNHILIHNIFPVFLGLESNALFTSDHHPFSIVLSVSLYYFNYILYSQINYNNNNNNNNNNLYIYKAHIVNLVQTDLNKK